MAEDALGRLERTVLFQTLQAREDETRAGHEISERVKAVVGHVAPLLERVPEVMPEFTLHDPNHGAKVVELMAQFLPAETLARLNVVELSILIYAAYLHDLGMTSSREEREEAIRADAEYARLLAGDETRSTRLQRFKDEGDHRAATAVEDQVYTEYLRRTHVRRSARFIDERLSVVSDEKGGKENALAISWQGTPYSKWVRAVCDSHEAPVSRLRDTKTWPRDALVRNLRVNVQYLSLVLRLADILDLDPERTPKVLLDFINPKDPKSVIEWNKHRSLIGWEITPERIRFEAECTHPVYERALREFLGWIEVERQDSVLLASSYRDELSKVYRFDLTEPVTTEGVRSNGTYIYSDLKFNIDYQRVLNLLMGERLYGNPVVALRELLQNSVDAVRLRQALIARGGEEPVEPHIAVRLDGDTLVIDDNGVGMDEHIVKNYFMQVGRSYYRSAEFRARQLDIDPVSEFGIGILSVFMVADRCEVETRRHPEDPLNPQPSVRIEIPTAYDYFVQRHTDRKQIGTTITLHLKPNHPFKPETLLDTVAEIAPFIEYPVEIETPSGTTTYRPRKAGEQILGDNIKRVFQVPLENSDDPRLEGVFGSLYVKAGGGDLGIVSQRGFAIWREMRTETYNSFGLLPSCATVEASVDLRRGAELSLTPDRESVIDDERLAELQSTIEEMVIQAFRAHLEERRDITPPERYASYVDELLDKEALYSRQSKITEGLKNLFLDLVPVHCITDGIGVTRRFGREFEKARAIALTSKESYLASVPTETILAELTKTVGPGVPLLYLDDSVSQGWRGFTRRVWGAETEVAISSTPGLVFSVIRLSEASDGQANRQEDVSFRRRFTLITTGTSSGRAPILIHPPDEGINGAAFNARHPLVSFLNYSADELKNKARDELFNNLDARLDDIFDELAVGTVLMMKGPDGKYVDRSEYPNFVLVGVLKREPSLLDSLRSLFEEFWVKAKEAGLVDEDTEFPGLTAEDLPWFWSYEGEGV